MSHRPAKKSKDASSSGSSAGGAATAATPSTAPVAGPVPPPPPKPQRTIQVKIGSQAPKTMTPDQAAEYLKSIAGKGGFGGAREVKMTFGSAPVGTDGPSSSSSTTSASSRSGKSAASKKAGSSSAAAASSTTATGTAEASTAATTANSSSSSASTTGATGSSSTRRKANKDGMPCSEKEMKALMSMFVEIMGLQMNVDKLNASHRTASNEKKNGGSNNSSGSDDSDPNHNSNGDTDSLPDLESATTVSASSTGTTTTTTMTTTTASGFYHVPPMAGGTGGAGGPSVVTGLAGIPPFEWEALERVAIEDALEQEERARKSHGRSGKDGSGSGGKDGNGKAKSRSASVSSSSYPPFYPAAATYSTGAGRSGGGTGSGNYGSISLSATYAPVDTPESLAKKKHDKDVQAWKAQVVAAVQGSTVDKLKKCLSECPLQVNKSSADKAALIQLIPYCVGSKNRKRKDSRDALTEFIASLYPSLLVVEPARNGRSVIHTLCYEADTELLGSVLPSIPDFDLPATCSDSGLTPLMYACLSGSVGCMELLLAGKADCRDVTNPTHTWQKDDVGLTCRQLLECILSSKQSKTIETHGMALEEVRKKMAASKEYVMTLEHMLSRLRRIESSGYSPRSPQEIDNDVAKIRARVREEEAVAQAKPKRAPARDTVANKSSSGNESKNDPSEQGEDESRQDTVTSSSIENATGSAAKSSSSKDPVVAALLGMGFSEPEIMKGIRACGGLDRATADNVVAWIFGGQQESAETYSVEPESVASSAKSSSVDRSQSSHATPVTQQRSRSKRQTDAKHVDAARKAEEERRAAEMLAAKREEQRRRNREWNNRAQVRQQQEDQAKIGKVAALAGVSSGSTAQLSSVGVAPPATSYFPQPPAGPAAQPRLKTGLGLLGLSSTHTSSQGAGNGPHLTSNDGATIASSIDVEIGNDDATVSTLGSLQTRATPIPFGSQPPKVASQVGPPGFSNQFQPPPEQRSLPTDSILGSTLMPSASLTSLPPPGIPESDPLVMEARRLPTSAFSSHAFGILPPSFEESRSGPSADLVSTGLLVGLQQTSATALSDASSLFSTGLLHHAPSPAPALPMPPGYGVSRMQSAPASFAPASTRSSLAPVAPHAGMPIQAARLAGAASIGYQGGSHRSGVLDFGLDAQHPIGQPQAVRQTIHQQTLDASIIDSISTGGVTDMAASSLWGSHNPHGAETTGGSSLLGSLLSASNPDSADASSLFANPHSLQHPQRHQESPHLNEGLWGSSSSGFQNAQGGGSIW